jgi:hypothetical protein
MRVREIGRECKREGERIRVRDVKELENERKDNRERDNMREIGNVRE